MGNPCDVGEKKQYRHATTTIPNKNGKRCIFFFARTSSINLCHLKNEELIGQQGSLG
jgi:hypothetical protein